MQHLPERLIGGESGIRQSLIEASDRPLIHLFVRPVPAVHFNHAGLVAIGLRICAGAAESLGPIGRQPFDMLGMKAVAESMTDYFVFHDAAVPGFRKAPQALVTTGRLEDSSHIFYHHLKCLLQLLRGAFGM